MRGFLVGVSAVVLGTACGDNSRQCGAGTAEVDGVCTNTGQTQCGEGTILDANTNTCVIDPSSCQDGTVLVGDQCVDPGAVTADLEEAAEPNGLGLLGEDSANDAGVIVLKPAGETFVIHGKIEPFQDLHGSLITGDPDPDGQPDVDGDTYLLNVTEPTLITVAVDGLHGLSGGFFSITPGPDPTLANSWTRIGINLAGDTAKRQLYLPAAGVYAIAITDSRTLITGEAVAPAAGGLALDYYVSITTETVAPAALTSGFATGTLAPGEVKLFTVPTGLGFNVFSVDEPAEQVIGSVVVANVRGSTNTIRGVTDEDGGPALVSAVGFKTGDVTTVAVDHVQNLANAPVDFTLTVKQSPVAALSTTGGTATAANEPDPASFTTFFYDVTAANEIDGTNISFDTEVAGIIFDENGNVFSQMSSSFFGFDGMLEYVGHLRHPAPGRYYFSVFDFNNPNSTANITATSTITPITPATITEGAATGDIDVGPFRSKVFTYARGNDPWQQLSGDTDGGTIQIRMFDPATAFGRLDDLSTDFGDCTPSAADQSGFCDDAFPFGFAISGNVTDKVGRIVLDDPTTWIVVINKTVDSGTFDATVAVRDNVIDLGTKNAGETASRTGDAIDNGANPVRRYIIRTQRDNEVQVELSSLSAGLDARIAQNDFNEFPLASIDDNGPAANEIGAFYQVARGWTAVTVIPVTQLTTAESFDIDVTINPAAFTVAATATAFADACVGGTTQTLIATGSFPADDDGLTGTLSAPAGFTFFGDNAPQLKISSNGWLTFDTSTTTSAAGNTDLPDDSTTPRAIVAPYWDDLANVVVCTKNSGGKLIVQWVGTTFTGGLKVQTQAILDGTDSTIEFVWGPTQTALGDSATIGVQNADTDKAKVIGVDQANSITAASSKKLTSTL